MKYLRTRKMQEMARKGVLKIKRAKLSPPGDGMLLPIFTEELANGWYYQVDFIHDTRKWPDPVVAVYAFRPPRRYTGSADYCFYESAE